MQLGQRGGERERGREGLEEEEKEKLESDDRETESKRGRERRAVLSGQHQLCVSLSPRGSALFCADAHSLLQP